MDNHSATRHAIAWATKTVEFRFTINKPMLNTYNLGYVGNSNGIDMYQVEGRVKMPFAFCATLPSSTCCQYPSRSECYILPYPSCMQPVQTRQHLIFRICSIGPSASLNQVRRDGSMHYSIGDRGVPCAKRMMVRCGDQLYIHNPTPVLC
jgi:hypothetical protein